MAESRHWSDIAEVGFVGGMRLLFWCYRHVGAWAFYLVLQPVVLYYFVTGGRARRASRDFLRRLRAHRPTAGTPRPGYLNSYRHFLSFSRATVDKLGVWAGGDILARVQFPGRPQLLELLDRGRGALLLGGHLGNMEICRSLSRLNHRLKLNVLVHTGHADRFNRLLREMDIDCELELIEVSELSPATAIRLSEAVARGEFVAVLADRVPVASRGRTRQVDFLGAPAPLPEGPFILASLLRCPVYTVFCTRSSGHYEVACEHFAEEVVLPRGDRDAALGRYMQQYARVLEEHAYRAPLQWFNFYPFWKQPA